MAKSYNHLTRGERERIRLLRLEKRSLSYIAQALSRAKSTISREVRRHLHHNGYEPERADGRAKKLRSKARRSPKMMVAKIESYVKEGLKKDWSPEQIAGRMCIDFPNNPEMRISHQAIYNWLFKDKKTGGKWHKHLRMNSRRKKKHKTRAAKRIHIKNRRPIEERPKSVELRRFYGDWEADTVEGKLNLGRIATLVERKSLYTVIAKMETRHAHCLNNALLATLCQRPQLPMRTITVDNGSEFARHELLSEALHADVYFAEPYCSWQRGLNENTNGLIRQYFPKRKTDFLSVSTEEIARVECLLNNRPRKKLGYRTPREVMAGYTFRRSVALRT